MSDAPERIWICTHLGEYGNYYPEAVEAEGDHGGTAAEYIRKDVSDALIAAALEEAANEVHQECWTDGGAPSDAFIVNAEQATTKLAMDAIKAVTPTDARAALEALISKDKTDG